jgi:hypothetical protein
MNFARTASAPPVLPPARAEAKIENGLLLRDAQGRAATCRLRSPGLW